ncbi:hypothetical protein ALC53_13434 [Atta colombica]|uniref:Reverse transcriptase domain-containing protein n=1 Tax=Atta colombica TaxID=520822 RepID=A0A151HYE0_9HYME|nr:hypothetical protein ALC53_13434 [Atta colombica]
MAGTKNRKRSRDGGWISWGVQHPTGRNIFMEHFEKEILRKHSKNQKFGFIDDTFVIWRHSRAKLRKFLIFLNNQHPNIHFTIDIEKNGKLPFLDVLVSKKADDTLSYQVYRKSTHRYLYDDPELHHHSVQKQSAINSLVHRAFIISDKEHLQKTQSLKTNLTEKRTRQKRHN